MGSAVGRTLRAGAEVGTTLDGRSERTARRAREAGIVCVGDLDAVVAGADVVLSIGPPGEAEAIAQAVARASSRVSARPLVADLNAISPPTALRIDATVQEAGLDFVDGSISGPPPRAPGTTRIYLSGPRAADVAALPFAGVEVIVVGAGIGTASAVKMCTASVYKGTVALLTEALLTARANGVLEHVLEDLGELADGAARSIARSATKSGRYVAEMREIAVTQAAAGLTPALFQAMATVYAGQASTPAGRGSPEDVPSDLRLEAVLDELAP
jgi:3-hydroxyisobutyrate dehydrogenase-like beta-hydroxyacid dehydrogenase